MSAANQPTVSLLLDDGTGTYPIDVSSRVSMSNLSWSNYGRADESTTAATAGLSLDLRNDDSVITTGTSVSLVTGDSSDFEGGVGGWTTVGGGSVAQSAVRAYAGTKSLLATWPTAASGTGRASVTAAGLTVGATYTLIASVYVPAASPNVRLMTGFGAQGSVISTKDTWVRVSLTFVATATTNGVQLATAAASTAGQQAWIDTVYVLPGYGAVTKGVKARFGLATGATTRTCFTGRLDSVIQGWDGAPGKRSRVMLNALDALAELARRPMRSLAQQEILAAGLAAYHPLGEVAGAAAGGDLTGQQTPLLPDVTDGFNSYAFGTDLGLPDGSTGATLTQGSTTGSASFLAKDGTDVPGTPTWSDSSVFLSIVFLQNGGAGAQTPLALLHFASGVGASGITFNSSGKALFNGCTSPTSLMDGLPHVISVQAGAGLSTDLWVDGVMVDTAAVMTNTWDNASALLSESGLASTATTFAHFAYGSRISDAQVQDIQNALLTSLAGDDTTDARLTRLAGYAGISATTDVPSGTVMGGQQTAGGSFLDAFQGVADVEGGVLFVDGSGTLTLQGRYYRTIKTSASLALTGKALDPSSTNPTDDTQQTINQVTVTRSGGAQQIASDQTSIDANGVFPQSLDLAVDTDEHALGHAQWVVVKHADPGPRLPSVTFTNLLTSPNAAAILAAELGDRISFSSMPDQTMPDLGDVTLEGWSMTLNVDGGNDEWTVTANLLPWDLGEAFILDSATYGVLDGATPIGY